MAKDGTNRGGRRVRAGDKPKPLAEKIAAGEDADIIEFTPTALEGADLDDAADLVGEDNQTNYSGAYGIWQHSEKGSVDGINGNVDLDICYKDFPTVIKAKGLNGYGKEEVLPNPPAPAVDDSIAVEATVDGKKYSGKLNKV